MVFGVLLCLNAGGDFAAAESKHILLSLDEKNLHM
jgi:hypothetical protein